MGSPPSRYRRRTAIFQPTRRTAASTGRMAMHVVQLLLPLRDNGGEPFDSAAYADTRGELTARFGGVTAFVRAPARGLWKEEDGDVVADDIVVYEVMVEELDAGWWREYTETLRRRFRQDELLVRAIPCVRL